MISNIYPVSLFVNHLVAVEYHEQKFNRLHKTGLFKSCLFAKIELRDSG